MSITNVPFFSPRSITGCSFWFDATDSSTITLSSGSLTQWNDKSGNGRNLTAVSGYANATVSSAFQNGLNVFNFSGNGLNAELQNGVAWVDENGGTMTFDGTNDQAVVADNSLLDFPGDFTIEGAVFRQTGGAGWRRP